MSELITVSMEGELATLLKQRAKQLDLNRSQYVRKLIKADLKLKAPKGKGGQSK